MTFTEFEKRGPQMRETVYCLMCLKRALRASRLQIATQDSNAGLEISRCTAVKIIHRTGACFFFGFPREPVNPGPSLSTS